MKLGMRVGLGPGHYMLDGDAAPPPQRGAEFPIFGPYVAAKWMDGSSCHLPLSMERAYEVGLSPSTLC